MSGFKKQISDFLFGPWRGVLVLGITQIVGWATLFYPPVLVMPLIAAERGWSLAFAMSGFSGALLVGGFASPYIGSAIDRFGGHVVMTFGSLIGAIGLVLVVWAANPVLYLAAWALLGLAMGASLYDPAFATLGRIFGAAARRPITAVTLAGGFASTMGWPAFHILVQRVGWHGTYFIYAGLLLCVVAPLHAFALPRERAKVEPYGHTHAGLPRLQLPPKGWPFILVAAGFAAYAFVPSGLAAHLLAMFERSGADAATVVAIGALFGPAQVVARLCEFIFARNVHPLHVARFALAMLAASFLLLGVAGLSVWTACLFAVIFGAANGLITIARGAVPLVLFGAVGYGRLLGRIAKPFLIMGSIAPLVMAMIIERASDAAALTLAAGLTCVALVCLVGVKRPR